MATFVPVANYPRDLYVSSVQINRASDASSCCQLCDRARLAEPEGDTESLAIAGIISDSLFPPGLWIGVQTSSGTK